MNDWLPIETAPKRTATSDLGSLFGPTINVSDGENEALAYWAESFDMDDGDGGTQWTDEGWYGRDGILAWKPTKWRLTDMGDPDRPEASNA